MDSFDRARDYCIRLVWRATRVRGNMASCSSHWLMERDELLNAFHRYHQKSCQCQRCFSDISSARSGFTSLSSRPRPINSSSSYILHPRRFINLQLPLPLPQQELDRPKILLIQATMHVELLPRECLEIRSSLRRFRPTGAETAAIEGEGVALEAGEAGHGSR